MAARKETSILDKVLWFDRRIVADIDYFDLLLPKREVSRGRRFHSGLYRSLKCNRDIQYESALELRFAELLEQDERVRFYWEQPVKIPYWRGRRKVYYTPDFGIYLASGHVVLAEVKELSDMLDYRVEQKTEALMAFCARRGFGMLLTDGRHTPADLLKGKVNRRLERALLNALGEHPLRAAACRELLERCNASASQLHKAVIRHNLRYRSFPMQLRQGNDNPVFREVFFGCKNYDKATEMFARSTLDGRLGRLKRSYIHPRAYL